MFNRSTKEEREMLFLDKIDKGIIYVIGQKVHRNDEKYYLKLLEEGRRKEQMIYGYHIEDWEEQKYLNRLRRQQKKQKRDIEELETYRDWETDRKSTRLNSSHSGESRMPSSA